jgi:hypothetical protein
MLRRALAGDFTVSWLAARALLAGVSPYQVIQPIGEYPFNAPFYYPLTAALAAFPFAWLPGVLAGGAFFGVGAGLLAYAILREGCDPLPIFLSAPFLVAVALAQWSPLLLAAYYLSPSLSWLLACKPNLGIPLFFASPSWRRLIPILLFGLASLAVRPTWLFEWQNVFTQPSFHRSPLFVLPWGALLLVSAIRWRRPEGRLLFLMAMFPQSLWFTDQLVLWAIPRTRASSWALTAGSWLAYFLWRMEAGGMPPISGADNPGRYIVLLMYLPALLMVLLPDASLVKKWLPGNTRNRDNHVK